MLNIIKLSKYVEKEFLLKLSKEAFYYIGEEFEIGVKFACENCIRGLNKQYRGKDEPTNVLTFNADRNSKDGDIVICEAVVEKEAKALNRDVSDLVALYFVHGILHLTGFDHKKAESRAKMESAEEEILKRNDIKIER